MANQALIDDLFAMFSVKFDRMQRQIQELQNEVRNARKREATLEKMLNEIKTQQRGGPESPSKEEIYVVGYPFFVRYVQTISPMEL